MSRCKPAKYVGGFLGAALDDSDYIFTPRTHRRKFPYAFKPSVLDHAEPVGFHMSLEDEGFLSPRKHLDAPPYWIDDRNHFSFGAPRLESLRGDRHIKYTRSILPEDELLVRMEVHTPPRIYRDRPIEVILD